MAHHSVIYGYICGANWKTDDYYRLHRLNLDVLNGLPELDEEYPWINRSMFSVPNQQGTFRDQVITFGASYKTLEYEWHLWMDKFEQILKQLYWYNVSIHANFEVMGEFKYEWLIHFNQMKNNWFIDNPIPIIDWEFKTNGPRSFEGFFN